MKRKISALLIAAFLIGITSGCGNRNTDSDITSVFGSLIESSDVADSGEEASAAEVTVSGTGSFSMPYNESYGWDPYECLGMENRAVMQLIYESLFVMDTAYDPVPVLCESYTLSDDGLTYTITLQSATFSSGKALTASDVVYSMRLAAQSTVYSERFDDVYSYYAADENTVIIYLSTANDRLPCLMDFPIIPENSSTNAPVGTGPFVRNGTVLTANTLWWQGVDTLNFQSVTLCSSDSAEDTRDNFEIDYVHLVYTNPSASSAATYHGNYELWNSGGTVMQYIGFNFKQGIFQDASVRAAITHAIDRASIAESVYHNLASSASLPVSPDSSMYDEELASRYAYTSTSEAINELLDTASFYLPDSAISTLTGTADTTAVEESSSVTVEEDEDSSEEEVQGEGITYNNITMLVMDGNLSRVAAANLVAENLTAVGFTVTVKTYSESEFYYYLYNSSWDIYYGEVTLKPDFDLRSILKYGGSLNFGGLSGGDTLTNLISSAMENSGNRYDLYEYIMDRGYICPVLFVNNAVFTTRGVFSGLDPSPDSLFYQISNIYVNRD